MDFQSIVLFESGLAWISPVTLKSFLPGIIHSYWKNNSAFLVHLWSSILWSTDPSASTPLMNTLFTIAHMHDLEFFNGTPTGQHVILLSPTHYFLPIVWQVLNKMEHLHPWMSNSKETNSWRQNNSTEDSHLFCPWSNWDHPTRSYMALSLPGLILEYIAKNNTWTSMGVTKKKKTQIKCTVFTSLLTWITVTYYYYYIYTIIFILLYILPPSTQLNIWSCQLSVLFSPVSFILL